MKMQNSGSVNFGHAKTLAHPGELQEVACLLCRHLARSEISGALEPTRTNG